MLTLDGLRASLAVPILVLSGVVLVAAQQNAGFDAGGREAVEAACSGCHQLEQVFQARKTPDQWETTVADMINRGAPVIEGERELIVQFLAANYGPEGRSVPGAAATRTPAAAPAGSVQATSPDARGRRVLQEACTVCHALDFVYQSRRTRSEWEETVGDMMGRGALLVEGEREFLLQFLAKNYGPINAKVSVNEATAQQLMTTFGLSQSEAEALLRYKQQHGVILGWEDLRKIPDLDLKKFEVKREFLAFL